MTLHLASFWIGFIVGGIVLVCAGELGEWIGRKVAKKVYPVDTKTGKVPKISG